MNASPKSPITLALKIVSAEYRHALGENVTEADERDIRIWVGQEGENMSAHEAACMVLLRELTREKPEWIQ